MKPTLTVEDVLHDIEIELLQSAVTHNELGQSVAAVRSYQNRLRSELLDRGRLPEDVRKAAAAHFELTDMVLTLLEETAIRLQTVQWEQQRLLRRLLPTVEGPPKTPGAGGELSSAAPTESTALNAASRPAHEYSLEAETVSLSSMGDATSPVAEDDWSRRAADLQKLLTADQVHVQVDVQPSSTPVVGPALGNLKAALHSLVIFYVNRFADRQSAVNQALGGWVLELQDALRRQQDDIDLLRGEVRGIQERLGRSPASVVPEERDS